MTPLKLNFSRVHFPWVSSFLLLCATFFLLSTLLTMAKFTCEKITKNVVGICTPSPRCDGYVVSDGDRMTAEEAERYHYNQVKVLSDGGVDYVMFACTVFHQSV